MELQDIEKLFPLRVKVTQNILNKGKKNINLTQYCIGALSLRKGLAKYIKCIEIISWGRKGGSIWLYNSFNCINIKTHRDMMNLKKPQTIIFKLKENG